MNIRWVKQEHALGCVIACLAMLTGQTYAKVADDLQYDGQQALGAYEEQEYLRAHGITLDSKAFHAGGDKYRWYGDGDRPFEGWPPKPYADVMLLSVHVGDARIAHRVIWFRDGSILDPLTPEPRTIADYSAVNRCERVIWT